MEVSQIFFEAWRTGVVKRFPNANAAPTTWDQSSRWDVKEICMQIADNLKEFMVKPKQLIWSPSVIINTEFGTEVHTNSPNPHFSYTIIEHCSMNNPEILNSNFEVFCGYSPYNEEYLDRFESLESAMEFCQNNYSKLIQDNTEIVIS